MASCLINLSSMGAGAFGGIRGPFAMIKSFRCDESNDFELNEDCVSENLLRGGGKF